MITNKVSMLSITSIELKTLGSVMQQKKETYKEKGKAEWSQFVDEAL